MKVTDFQKIERYKQMFTLTQHPTLKGYMGEAFKAIKKK